ncbi:MAG: sialate O-acetylesterase [Planctomycetaceae bacterium]
MQYLTAILLSVLIASSNAFAQRPEFEASKSTKPVKVFILAGQSNMQGKGFPEPLAWQLSQQQYRGRYENLIRNGDYESFLANVEKDKKSPEYDWSVRKDVWINYLDRRGNLSVGYGNPNKCFGPELNFGHVVGNHIDEQVLIIKTSWGGRALAKGFLPPSSMASDEEYARLAEVENQKRRDWNEKQPAQIEKYNARITEQNKTAEKKQRPRTFKPKSMISAEDFKAQYGSDYRNMVKEVHTCLAELKTRFPGYKDQGYELAGFVWFQGWNDQYNDYWLSYEKNLANFIRDVRVEFKSPKLPFVIGQMGNGGTVEKLKADSPRAIIKQAQAAVADYPEFEGTVTCVKTDQFWDMEAHAIYTGPGGWNKDVNKWRQFGNDRPYHYYGSPWFFAQAGTGFGDAMLRLLK